MTAPPPPPWNEERNDERIAGLTRAVMQRINNANLNVRPLQDIPTLFAFGPIYDAIREAEARGKVEGLAERATGQE